MPIQRERQKVYAPNELDRLSDFLMEEILNTPDDELLAEAVQEFGDLRAFEAKTANVVNGNSSDRVSRK